MRRVCVLLFLALALGRFGHVAYRGLTFSIGDYYATLPGAYVRTLNPTLWASPDLVDVVGKSSSYRRGPTQFITLYPLAFLDSYREISLLLLPLYGLLIVASAVVMWRAFADRADLNLKMLILGSSLLFYPTLQAYIAREFEIVLLLATAWLAWSVVRGRNIAAGAWIAYLSLYKFLPLATVPYLIARRWWRGLAGFAISAAVILGVSHAAFGLRNFSSDGFVQGLASGMVMTLGSSQAFCDGRFDFLRYAPGLQDVSVRFALCGISHTVGFPVVAVYLALIVATLAALAYGFFRAERMASLAPVTERWRRTWEISAVVIVYTTFFYSHYYYLAVLMVPLAALLVRAYEQRSPRLWALWATSYLLLSAFLIPMSFVSHWLQVDLWWLYLSSFLYLPGELILLAVVLHEYATLPLDAAAARPPN